MLRPDKNMHAFAADFESVDSYRLVLHQTVIVGRGEWNCRRRS